MQAINILNNHLRLRRKMILLKMKQSIAQMKLIRGARQYFERYGNVETRLVVHKGSKEPVRMLPLVTVKKKMNQYLFLKEKGLLSPEFEQSWG